MPPIAANRSIAFRRRPDRVRRKQSVPRSRIQNTTRPQRRVLDDGIADKTRRYAQRAVPIHPKEGSIAGIYSPRGIIATNERPLPSTTLLQKTGPVLIFRVSSRHQSAAVRGPFAARMAASHDADADVRHRMHDGARGRFLVLPGVEVMGPSGRLTAMGRRVRLRRAPGRPVLGIHGGSETRLKRPGEQNDHYPADGSDKAFTCETDPLNPTRARSAISWISAIESSTELDFRFEPRRAGADEFSEHTGKMAEILKTNV